MTLLLQFLQKLLIAAPSMVSVVEEIVAEMRKRGQLTETQKTKLIRQIQPTKQRDIDARIDAQVAERFPKDD